MKVLCTCIIRIIPTAGFGDFELDHRLILRAKKSILKHGNSMIDEMNIY